MHLRLGVVDPQNRYLLDLVTKVTRQSKGFYVKTKPVYAPQAEYLLCRNGTKALEATLGIPDTAQ